MRARAVLVAAGVLVMGWAAAGAVLDPDLSVPGVLGFLAGVLIAHDLIVMPAVLAVGVLIRRLAPARRRPALAAAAISAVAVTVVAAPLVLGFGRAADDPSVLPLPYGRNLAIVLTALAVVGLLPHRRRAGRKKSERTPGDAREGGDG